MVLLTITPAAKAAVDVYNSLSLPAKPESENEPSLAEPKVGEPISHGQLIDVSRALQEHNLQHDLPISPENRLEALLKGAKLYVPPPKPKPAQTREYVALMAHLREEEERRAYERMINPQPPKESFAQRFPSAATYGAAAVAKSPVAEDDDEATYADVNRQMTLIINVLVTVIASSVTIWIAARHWNAPARLALSMTGSVVIAIAEVVIYMGYVRRIEESKSDEVRRKEAKEIVDTWVIDGKKSKVSGVDAGNSVRLRRGKHR